MVGVITDVWNSVLDWLVSAFNSVQGLFYDAAANSGEGGLTFIGVLAVIGVAISIALLVVSIVQGFLKLRG